MQSTNSEYGSPYLATRFFTSLHFTSLHFKTRQAGCYEAFIKKPQLVPSELANYKPFQIFRLCLKFLTKLCLLNCALFVKN